MIVVEPLILVVIAALNIYKWVLVISIILSWLVAFEIVNMRNRYVYMVGNALNRLTEPALRPIRRFMPNLGGIDISPIALFLLIWLLQEVLGNILISLPRVGS